jgi:hypothetical protein
MTLLDLSSNLTVRFPVPGPISRVISEGRILDLSIILRKMNQGINRKHQQTCQQPQGFLRNAVQYLYSQIIMYEHFLLLLLPQVLDSLPWSFSFCQIWKLLA